MGLHWYKDLCTGDVSCSVKVQFWRLTSPDKSLSVTHGTWFGWSRLLSNRNLINDPDQELTYLCDVGLKPWTKALVLTDPCVFHLVLQMMFLDSETWGKQRIVKRSAGKGNWTAKGTQKDMHGILSHGGCYRFVDWEASWLKRQSYRIVSVGLAQVP